MKKILTLILLALFVQAGFAQEEPKEEMKTLITGKHLKFSGCFISPELKGTIMNDGYGFLMGGRLGVIFNDKFSIGLGGYGLTTEHLVDLTAYPEVDDIAKIGFGYGGLVLEYTLFGNKAVHFSIPVLIGGGGVNLYKDIVINEDEFTWDDFNTYESSAFFVIEPGINLELNVTKFMRFDLGASYRMVQFSEMEYLENSNSELSNFAVNASLKFGLFSKTKKEKTTK